MFEEKIVKANEEIKKVADYLKEHEEAFQSMNLKLYDAFYYFMSDEMKKDFPLAYADNEGRNEWSDFDWFCDDNYRMFEEDLEMNFGIDFSEMKNQIGRTSSFYLHDGNIIEFYRYDDISTDCTIDNFIDYYHNNQYGNYTEINNGTINTDGAEEYPEEIENELDYIINDLYNDVVSYCEDIITVYGIIKGFKDNQVQDFKEYLEIQEERLQEEKEEKEKALKEEEEERKRLEEREKNIEYLKKIVKNIQYNDTNNVYSEIAKMMTIIENL